MSVRSLVVIAVLLTSGSSAIALTNAVSLASPLRQTSVQVAQNQRPRSGESWLRELNLSPDQLQKIQEIRNRYQQRLTEQRQAVRQAQQELKQLMASNASAEQIRQKYDQMQTLKQALGDTRMESMLAIRNVLNAEQRQKLTEILRQRGRNRSTNL